MRKCAVVLLPGFLGSGKTTVLLQLLGEVPLGKTLIHQRPAPLPGPPESADGWVDRIFPPSSDLATGDRPLTALSPPEGRAPQKGPKNPQFDGRE